MNPTLSDIFRHDESLRDMTIYPFYTSKDLQWNGSNFWDYLSKFRIQIEGNKSEFLPQFDDKQYWWIRFSALWVIIEVWWKAPYVSPI